jgi:flagellar biosynthetic protein FliR
MFSAAVYAGLPRTVQVAPEISLAGLVPLVLSEMIIGAAMGFIAGLPIVSMDMAGVIMGHQMGMGLGRVYNPDLGADTDSLGQILTYVGLATFVALNGLDAMFLALIYTFAKVPIGTFAGGEGVPIDAMVGVLTSGTELALRVSAPILCIIFLLMIALGLIGKTMPQINIMSVGFTVKMFFGIAVLAGAMGIIQQVTAEEIERVLGSIVEWGRTMGSG